MNIPFGRRARLQLVTLLALALSVGALWLGSRPAAAQEGTGAANFTTVTARKPPAGQTGQKAPLPAAQSYLGLSPYLTSFQLQQTTKQQNPPNAGQIVTERRNHVGPLIDLEKLYFLHPVHKTQYSTFTLGGWYWYSQKSSDNKDNDRFAGYTQYFYDQRVGAQLSLGGGTRLGIYEYYVFGLYNLTNSTAKSPLGVQVGLGPYVPRRSIGDTGYTALLDLTLAPKSRLVDTGQTDADGNKIVNLRVSHISYSASIWYVSFRQPVGGANLNKTNDTLRLNFNINYRL